MRFTPKEKHIIYSNFTFSLNGEIAKLCTKSSGIKRSSVSIRVYASTNKITNEDDSYKVEGFSVREVMKLTNVSYWMIIYLINRNHLKNVEKQRSLYVFTQDHIDYLIDMYKAIPNGYIWTNEASDKIGIYVSSLNRSLKNKGFHYLKKGFKMYIKIDLMNAIIKQLKDNCSTKIDYKLLMKGLKNDN